jgi:4-amino-4-deoxy-L-arabinose transferase-like glycosyltransferase
MRPLKNSFSDIRFWIVLFFFLRLYAITDPPLEIAHNWRQVTVCMSARNFAETDSNIFYPRVDFAGEKTGITGMEFPLLNYLIYLVSLVFGYAHWYGRLINLLISSVGLWYFFILVKKYFTSSLAFKATFILLFSAWFTYSRKIMPDTFSMSLMLAGIYYGSNYLDTKHNLKNLLLYFVFLLLGALSKLPSMYLLIILSLLLFQKEIPLKAKIVFSVTSTAIITCVTYYYFDWVPYLTEHYGFYHFFMGKGLAQGFAEILNNLEKSFEKFYLEALQIIGFIIFVTGLTLAIVKKNKPLLLVFLVCFASYAIVVLKAGVTFSRHSYYIIPFTPVMALVAAFAIEAVKSTKLKTLLLALILIEGISNKFHDFYIKDDYKAMLQLETHLDGLGSRSDFIAINSGDVPTPMYFSHRKGWVTFNETLCSSVYINDFKTKGLRFIIILKNVFGTEVPLPYNKVFENQHYAIYQP